MLNTTEITKTITDNGGRIFLVGGAVRDQFIGNNTQSKDLDFIVTGIPLEHLFMILKRFGKVDLVGKSFGVLKLFVDGEQFDFALPRVETSTGEGHWDFNVKVDHTLSIEDDLGRRDFTMNAIAIDQASGEIIDPFGGRDDIKKRTIKAIFHKTFEEDPLRMLRAVQFAARFNFKIDQPTRILMRREAHRINSVSGERVLEEIKKILLKAEKPSVAFKLMKKTGILAEVFPELQATVGLIQGKKFHVHDAFDHIMAAVDSVPSVKLHVRMAALFHDIAKPLTRSEENGEVHFFMHEHMAVPIIAGVLARWKASTELTQKVIKLVGNHMFELDFRKISPRAVRRLISRVGADLIHDLVDLRVGDRIASGKVFLSMGKIGKLREMIDRELAEPAFSVENLAIGGKDLIELGLTPGPEFGTILKGLLEAVIENKELNTREALIALVKERTASPSSSPV